MEDTKGKRHRNKERKRKRNGGGRKERREEWLGKEYFGEDVE